MESFHRWRNLGMLLRGFEMRKRSQGSETFLHLNAEKNEGDAKGGREQLSGSTWQHSHMALLTGGGKVWYSDGAVWFIQQL